jgi:hypothetical protein
VALVLLQLGLEALEQGEGVGRGAGKAGQHLVMVELAHLARAGLDDGVAQGDLAVAAQATCQRPSGSWRRTLRMVVPW